MNCPIDNTALVMTDRQGIEIDYCPQCRGVWLDRGELDKIIDRSSASVSSTPSPMPAPAPTPQHYDQPQPRYNDRHSDRRDDRHYDQGYKKKHKKEGFLGDLFDF